ncbi:GDSL-like lipase/acylhydrolase, putative [Synechococcus sp. PCC 7335]|uniref:GDSL-type esterase/lipase family protein n=1 Tax=Synechococcus sp. (strain ATCC 29403 / PCC 7335) TaxID=91464 RepID=UPI00017EB4C6|nr:GDSL-type esterase/lipase family protein [Synechococcus sp. PCC 7335]EDX87281.1 GDSL-like lipase/acylhydrolase, putative [Synechococcus sp. PCC 7335]
MKDIRICFFGDSFVAGTGDPTYLGWVGRACAAMTSPHYNLTVYNLGIRGNTSEQIEVRWLAEAAKRFPSETDNRVVFSFGTNDNRVENGIRFVEEKDSVLCARRILTQAKAMFPSLLIGPPPVADENMNYRAKTVSANYSDLCAELDVPYLDVYQPLHKNALWMQEVAAVDGAHPGASGYLALSQLITQWSAWQSWFAQD